MARARSTVASTAAPDRRSASRAKDKGPRYSKADQLVRLVLALQSSRTGLTLDDIRERGYAGGYTMVKAFVASLRQPAAPEPAVFPSSAITAGRSGSAASSRCFPMEAAATA